MSQKACVWDFLVSRLVLLLLGTGTAWAGSFTAFGPQTYARNTGAPATVSYTFSILNPNTQYTLHVDNSGVSSAVVAVNGDQILGPSDFDANVGTIDRPVTLNTSNEISVQLRSAPGSAMRVSIIGVDNDPPIITASASPHASSLGWNDTDVVVTFTCSDQTSGIAFCPAPVTVSAEGVNQAIQGQAQDKAGNTANTRILVSIDKTPPVLAITSPVNGSTLALSSNSVNVAGAVSDLLSGVSNVTCGGTPAQLAGSTFSCAVSLTLGPNAISIQATDVAGNSTTSILNLIYSSTPQVTITSPTDLSFSNVSPITVMGTVSDSHATLTVNGIPTPLTSGAFSVLVPLVDGLNTINAVAINSAGIIGTAAIHVTLDTASQGPLIESIAPIAAVVGKPMQYQLVVSSANPSTLNFSLALAPPGMTIDPTAGLVSWTPASNQVGDQSVVVNVRDSTGQTNQAFTLSVFGTRVAASVAISAIKGGTVLVTDPNSKINGLSLVIPPAALPADATITISELILPPTLGGTTHFFMQAFSIDPDGTVLSVPATVTIPYQPSQFGQHDGIPLEDFLGVYFLNDATGYPEFLSTYSTDFVNHVITAALPHFSSWINTNIARLCPPPVGDGEGVFVDCTSTKPAGSISQLLPTVLVHGFQFSFSGMGDESTWGNLRTLLTNLDGQREGHIDSWRFDWASRSVPFEKSGQNLRAALLYIESLQTASGPHLVNILAHSFGGILVRTYLEGQATAAPYVHDVNRVATLGTPHTGIGGDFSNGIANTCAFLARLSPGSFITCFEAGTGGSLSIGSEGEFLRNLNTRENLPALEGTNPPSYLHIKGQRLAGSGSAAGVVPDDGLITQEGAQLCGGSPDVCAGTTVLEEAFPPGPPGSTASIGLCHSRALIGTALIGETCDSRLNNIPMAEINNTAHPLWQEICTFLGCVPAIHVFVSDQGSIKNGGTVTSIDGKIDCGTTCSAPYRAGTTITLTATPANGHTFVAWSGACTGTDPTCTISIPNDFPFVISGGGNLYEGIFAFAGFTVPTTASITSLSCTQSGIEPTVQTVTGSGVATGPGDLTIQVLAGGTSAVPSLSSLDDRTLLSFDCGSWVADPSTLTCQQPPEGPIQTNWQTSSRLEWFTAFGQPFQLFGTAAVAYFPGHRFTTLAFDSVACTMQ
ncbi:MAG TPA: putative Ig domain-containing protein [Candidatus Angelobacter sp.]|nr:putative Ig domain-containing protein [Candidatus Angelobacter sp.]